MLNAGLRGIEKGYKLPEPVETDVYHLTEKERHEMGIDQLPGSLIEAIEYAKESELLLDKERLRKGYGRDYKVS